MCPVPLEEVLLNPASPTGDPGSTCHPVWLSQNPLMLLPGEGQGWPSNYLQPEPPAPQAWAPALIPVCSVRVALGQSLSPAAAVNLLSPALKAQGGPEDLLWAPGSKSHLISPEALHVSQGFMQGVEA